MAETDPSQPSLPADIPAAAIPFLEKAGYGDAERLSAGDAAPDVPLWTLTGAPFDLRRDTGGEPVVLIFGSYT